MTPQAIYLQAAEAIDSGRERFSCCAIPHTFRSDYPLNRNYRDLYAKVMSPYKCREITTYDIDFATFGDEPENRNLRVLLLCMMAVAYDDLVEKEVT